MWWRHGGNLAVFRKIPKLGPSCQVNELVCVHKHTTCRSTVPRLCTHIGVYIQICLAKFSTRFTSSSTRVLLNLVAERARHACANQKRDEFKTNKFVIKVIVPL